MDSLFIVIAVLLAAIVGAVFVLFVRRGQNDDGTNILGTAINNLATAQTELTGRLSQLAESSAVGQAQLSERLQAQERAVTKTLDERLADLTRRVGENLQQNTTRTGETMAKLQERLAVIDTAQKNITELSGQVVGLQDILANKQARGAFGEIQLQDLVKNALPPSAYDFQVTLGNGKRADCVVHLPNPPGSIVIDAKFPLEGYRAMLNAGDDAARALARRKFASDVATHVAHIAERYIVAGETAESALLFLPSEAVYAELHASFPEVIERSYSQRVWIVSPTTLMATLNTVRAVLKDSRMREQAGVIQQEVAHMLQDVGRLDQRVENLERHFGQAEKDLREIRTSAEKVVRRGEHIAEIELGDEIVKTLERTGGAQIHQLAK
ncbi:MAG: DNA recombination protein RmuC [Proteobacteria bacterium]|nr:DNA recombination protein RmuC [Pseudomonadota bacterium]MDA1323604.1 DNA recombination protein RmuC [Pseudomonadota bacterium]